MDVWHLGDLCATQGIRCFVWSGPRQAAVHMMEVVLARPPVLPEYRLRQVKDLTLKSVFRR